MSETQAAPVALDLLLAEARDALAIERDRANASEAKVAGYESAILWATSCLACARVLDSSIAETERRELAEDALAAERERADGLQAELNALGGRIGNAVRSAAEGERTRIRDLADRHEAVYAGDEGNATRFSALLTEVPGA